MLTVGMIHTAKKESELACMNARRICVNYENLDVSFLSCGLIWSVNAIEHATHSTGVRRLENLANAGIGLPPLVVTEMLNQRSIDDYLI